MYVLGKLGIKKIAVGLNKTTIVFDDGITVQTDDEFKVSAHRGREVLFEGFSYDDNKPEDLAPKIDISNSIRARIATTITTISESHP